MVGRPSGRVVAVALLCCLAAGLQPGTAVPAGTAAGRTPAAAADTEARLHNLLMSMQAQLVEYQTSQGRARSVLNVLREVQASQARDHHALKQRVFELEARQDHDRRLIKALTGRVADNGWGIVTLKGEHDQVRQDLGAFKTLRRRRHQRHNETAADEVLAQSIQMQWQQREAIQQLQRELISLRASLAAPAGGPDGAPRTHGAPVRPVDTDQSLASERRNFTTDTTARPTAAAADRQDTMTTSTTAAGKDSMLTTAAAAAAAAAPDTSPESDESESVSLEGERPRRAELARLSLQQAEQGAELLRLRTDLLNTTLQVARLESGALRREASHEHAALADMRHTLGNFTARILGLQRRHLASDDDDDGGGTARRHVSRMLLNHNERIVAAEEMLYAMRAAQRGRTGAVDRLRGNVSALASRFAEHGAKADSVFTNADDQLAAMRARAKATEWRLEALERNVLNASLRACRKSNMDLVQDTKLTEFSRSVRQVDSRLHTQQGRITKTSQGVTRLFEITKSQGKAVNNAINQMGNLLAILPDVETLKEDISNVLLQLPADCSGVPDIHPDRLPADGVYVIRPGGADHSRRVLCQFERLADGGTAAWTVIQRRVDAAVLFDRTWAEYGSGFGRLDSDFWLGNAALHQLTRRAAHRLRVEMRSTGGATWWAEYDHFGVAAESADYRLSVTGYRGNATDALRYSDGAAFSTSDADHDSSSTHCARLYAAGWWYRHCHYGNLNGRYAVGIVWFNQDVDEWMQMRQTVMKIRVAPPGGGNVTNAIGGKGGEEGGG